MYVQNNQFSVSAEITESNSRRQAYYKLRKRLCPLLFSSLEQLCKNMSLNFVKFKHAKAFSENYMHPDRIQFVF